MGNFGVYDFETYEWTKPLCCGLVWGDKLGIDWRFISNAGVNANIASHALREMMLIARECGVTDWWAHNGGKFDALMLVDTIMAEGHWDCKAFVAAGRITSLEVRAKSDGTKIVLRDSYAVVQSNLRQALKDFEIQTQKVFTEDDYKEDMRKLSPDKLRDGCMADCHALYALLERVQGMFENWGGKLKSTFSSSSLSVLKSKVTLPSHKGVQWANETARKSFMGGRVEVFQHKPMYELREYDINSSYPTSMCNVFPTRLLGRAKNPERAYSEGVHGIYFAQVSVPDETEIPPLPFKPDDKGMFFPVGTWCGWFALPELTYAQHFCDVHVRILDAVLYEHGTPFREFVTELYRTKETSTGAKRNFVKLVLNGCYGKFAQKPESVELMMFGSTEDALQFIHNTEDIVEPMRDDYRAVAVHKHRWPKQTHYAIASYVTAYSRVSLHQFLKASVDLAYCDTDSIHCRRTKGNQPIDLFVGSHLGGLKVELESMEATYYAPKLYALHSPALASDKNPSGMHYASKGFPVSKEAFESIIAGEEIKRERMQLLKTQLRTGRAAQMLTEEKKWNGRSNKRRPMRDGSTVPWTVDELREGAHLEAMSPCFSNRV